MILVDGNLLVYARASRAALHQATRRWLDEQLNGTARVGLPWPSLLAFVRLVTNPRIFERPETIVGIPVPTDRHRQILGSVLAGGTLRANLVPDAHVAALAVEHGCSTDGDFARFPHLKRVNPLAM